MHFCLPHLGLITSRERLFRTLPHVSLGLGVVAIPTGWTFAAREVEIYFSGNSWVAPIKSHYEMVSDWQESISATWALWLQLGISLQMINFLWAELKFKWSSTGKWGKEKYYVSAVSLEGTLLLCPLVDLVMAKLHWLQTALLSTDVHDTQGLGKGNQLRSEIHL